MASSLSISMTGYHQEITIPNTKYHMVEDNELETFMKTSTPTVISIGLSCLGYALGSLRDLWPILSQKQQVLTYSDIFFSCLFGIAICVGLILTIYGFCRDNQTKKILKNIRNRQAAEITLH